MVMEEKHEFQIAIGKHVRKMREAQGLSGAELARRCFLDRSNIHSLEMGKFSPSLFYLSKIAKGLDMSLSELLMGFGKHQ